MFFDMHTLDLAELLSNTNTGAILVDKYSNKVLDHQKQNDLVNLIINLLIEKRDTLNEIKLPKLKNHHLDIVASKITQIFTKEEKSTYYIAPKTEGQDQTLSKGKLPMKYRNWMTKARKAGLIVRRKDQKTVEEASRGESNFSLFEEERVANKAVQ